MKLYEIDIDGKESEVNFNSLVDVPAHLKKALKFNAQDEVVRFHFNDEKQIVTGVAIATDEPIYRYDPETKEEFNVVFRKSVVDKIIQQYFKKNYQNNLSLEHEKSDVLKSAYMIESYQVDESRKNSVPKAFESQNLQDGSWILSYKIDDKEEWEEVKSKEGFSIEGIFNLIEVKTKNQNNMSLLKKLGFKTSEEDQVKLAEFKKAAEKFAEAVLEDGTVLVYDGDLAEGTEVFIDVDDVLTPAPAETYALGGDMEGTVIEVSDEGVVTSVTKPDEQASDDDEDEEKMSRQEVETALSAMKKDYEKKFEELKTSFSEKEKELKEIKSDFQKFKDSAKEQASKNKFAGARKKESKNEKKTKRDILKDAGVI